METPPFSETKAEVTVKRATIAKRQERERRRQQREDLLEHVETLEALEPGNREAARIRQKMEEEKQREREKWKERQRRCRQRRENEERSAVESGKGFVGGSRAVEGKGDEAPEPLPLREALKRKMDRDKSPNAQHDKDVAKENLAIKVLANLANGNGDHTTKDTRASAEPAPPSATVREALGEGAPGS